MLVVLFLEINALALSVVAAVVVTHTLTAYVDIRYTSSRRVIAPFEQLAHAVPGRRRAIQCGANVCRTVENVAIRAESRCIVAS